MPFEKGETPQGAKPFKKGQSGNPKGRPKMPDLKSALAEYLADEKDGKTALDAIIMKLRQMAIKGNLKAAEMLLDRGYGKPKQSHELSGEDGEPIKVLHLIPPTGKAR